MACSDWIDRRSEGQIRRDTLGLSGQARNVGAVAFFDPRLSDISLAHGGNAAFRSVRDIPVSKGLVIQPTWRKPKSPSADFVQLVRARELQSGMNTMKSPFLAIGNIARPNFGGNSPRSY